MPLAEPYVHCQAASSNPLRLPFHRAPLDQQGNAFQPAVEKVSCVLRTALEAHPKLHRDSSKGREGWWMGWQMRLQAWLHCDSAVLRCQEVYVVYERKRKMNLQIRGIESMQMMFQTA